MVGPMWLGLYQRIKAAMAAQKRSAVYSGLTDPAGDFTIAYETPFSAPPHVAPQIIPQSNANRSCRVTASTAAGFTVRVEERASLSVLGVGLALGANATAVASAPVSVCVMEA